MTIQSNQGIKEILNEYNLKIDSYLIAGEESNKFFTNYNIIPQGHKFKFNILFNNLFKSISNNLLSNYKIEQQKIIAQISDVDSTEKEEITEILNSLCQKVEKCEQMTTTFRKGIAELLYKKPEALLDEESMLGFGAVAGTRTIGECHCCEKMNRRNRQMFTWELVSEIGRQFPQKKDIILASSGAGHTFHELNIHAGLAQKGYKATWLLNDPCILTNTTTCLDTVASFEMMANWITPSTQVKAVAKTAGEFFKELETQTEDLPDVFLFIDVDLHFSDSTIQFFGSKMKHRCLFATFAKNLEELMDFRIYQNK